MPTWLIDHSLNISILVLHIAVLAALVCALVAERRARRAECRAAGVKMAVDYLAARIGVSPNEICEAHYAEHPDCRPRGAA